MTADEVLEVNVTPGLYRTMFDDGFVVDVITPFGDSRMLAKLLERFEAAHGKVAKSLEVTAPEQTWADRLVAE